MTFNLNFIFKIKDNGTVVENYAISILTMQVEFNQK